MLLGLPPVGLAVVAATVAGACIGFGLGWLAWRNRDVPGSRTFAGIMAASGLWNLAYSVMLLTRPPVGEVAYAVQTAAAMASPALWLLFALEYTGHGEWVSRRVVGLLAVEPVVFYLLFWLPGLPNGLARGPVEHEVAAGLVVYFVDLTTGTLVHVLYTYAITVLGLALLVQFVLRTRNLYRRQATVIAVASTVTVVGNLLYLAQRGGIHPQLHPRLDLTAVFFALNGLGIAWALYRHDFLDVVPLAPDSLIAEMDDAMLVLDGEDTVVDHNPAAADLAPVDDPVGESVDRVLPGLTEAIATGTSVRLSRNREGDGDGAGAAGSTASDGGARATDAYDPELTPIRDRHGIERGRVVVLRDVTVRERRRDRLEGLQEATERFIDAETKTDIATVAVDIANTVLEYPFAGILLYDGDRDRLKSAALTPGVSEHLDGGDMVIEPGDGLVWQVFEAGESRLFDADDDRLQYDELPLADVLLLPLGSHGVLGLGTRTRGRFGDDDWRFAETLASAAESALDRAERETQLRESRAVVEQRNEQLELFNGMLRHNILNGMLVIDGNVERLRDHVDEDGEPYLETVSDWSEDITDLTRKVRAVMDALTEGRRGPLQRVDLAAELEDSVRKFDGTYPTATVDLDVPSGTDVLADDLLSEVVENVLLNAVEHNDTDDPHVEITVESDDDRVCLRIADDGPGMSDERKERAFEESFTSERSGTLGFGLYFVRTMMDAYDGDVWIEDNEPRGAVFVLEFRRPEDRERDVTDAASVPAHEE